MMSLLPNPVVTCPHIGVLAAGARNSIADVPGVQVGHCTLAAGPVQTGVTVVLPHGGDLFRDKVPAAAAVINGFGKSVGLLQIRELGLLETPIALTNTFSVGTVATAQLRTALAANPEIGRALPTLNPLVFECNDGYLNDLQAFAIQESHYVDALHDAGASFAQGAVGAGRGMSCFELKGGIGSASRFAAVGGTTYTVGALVLANFGKLKDLVLAGVPLGLQLARSMAAASVASDAAGKSATDPADDPDQPEKGSIIVILATDAPLDARQLHRLAVRSGAGLARTGSVYGHGSGDIALAFSTAQTVPQVPIAVVSRFDVLHDSLLDPLFHAVADSVEQAILNALFAATTVTGRNGHIRHDIRHALNDAPYRS